MTILLETNLQNLCHRGKVRDTCQLDNDRLLLVATDRISAFDLVMPTGIPDKGIILNQLSAFWFQSTCHIAANHLIEVVNNVDRLSQVYGEKLGSKHSPFPDYLARRSMVVRRAERIDVECVVRGYLSGSAWAEYRENGTAGGMRLPQGLRESEQLPQVLFTPTTKADVGHDQPISIEQMQKLIGKDLTERIIEKCRAIYDYAAQYARDRGIIIADTKMEFGTVKDELILIDELLTPDSSRFWDADTYSPGRPQASFDKQHLRDWLTGSGWNKEPPAPQLPPEVVDGTARRYREAYRRLTGKEL